MRLFPLISASFLFVGCAGPTGNERIAYINTTDMLEVPMTEATRASAQEAVEKLKIAIQLGDPRSISSIISYPLNVNGIPAIANASEFAAQFKGIFNAKVRAAVLAQSPGKFVQDATEGVMVGGGEVWLREACQSKRVSGTCPQEALHFLVVAINNSSVEP
jgi:hypothetical protein